MKDKDGNKYFTDNEKCHLMEQTKKDVFRITEEEEYSFDKQHSDHIDNNAYSNRIKSYPTANLTRLNTIVIIQEK